MAFEDRNAAYDLSLFQETSPRKREQQKPLKKKKPKQKGKVLVISDEMLDKNARRKIKPLKVAVTVLFGAIIAILLVVNIRGRVELTELNQKIMDAEVQLTQQQSIYVQNEMSVNTKYSTDVIEEYAKNELNMSRATNYQKEFVSLSDGDKAEIVTADEPNVFVRVVRAISEILS